MHKKCTLLQKLFNSLFQMLQWRETELHCQELCKYTRGKRHLQSSRSQSIKIFDRPVFHAENALNPIRHRQLKASLDPVRRFLIPASKGATDVNNLVNLQNRGPKKKSGWQLDIWIARGHLDEAAKSKCHSFILVFVTWMIFLQASHQWSNRTRTET